MLYNTQFVDDVVEICVRQGNIHIFPRRKGDEKIYDEMSSGMRQNEIFVAVACLLLCEMGR